MISNELPLITTLRKSSDFCWFSCQFLSRAFGSRISQIWQPHTSSPTLKPYFLLPPPLVINLDCSNQLPVWIVYCNDIGVELPGVLCLACHLLGMQWMPYRWHHLLEYGEAPVLVQSAHGVIHHHLYYHHQLGIIPVWLLIPPVACPCLLLENGITRRLRKWTWGQLNSFFLLDQLVWSAIVRKTLTL